MKKMPVTIVEIAQALNMSPSTVSRALNDHPAISGTTKENVRRKAQELNYVPNEAARFFQQKKSGQIGVIVPSLRDPFYVESICGMEAAAMQNNYKVLLCQSHESVEKEIELTNMLLLQRVEALVITISKNTTRYEHIEQLKKLQIPVLYFVRRPKLDGCNYAKNNVFGAAWEATSFFIQKGHRRIAHLTGPSDMITSNERLEGYKAALQAAGLPVDEALIQPTNLSEEGTVEALKRVLTVPERPTAVLTFKDYVALDAIEYLKKAEPELVSTTEFAGFGNTSVLRYMNYPLTASIEEYPYRLGEKAVNAVLHLINQASEPPIHINQDCTLKIFEQVKS